MDAQVNIDRHRAPARRGSGIGLVLKCQPGSQLRLELSGPASFNETQRESVQEFISETERTERIIYCTGRPGRVTLRVNGQRHMLRFDPSGIGQGLLYDWLPTLGLSLLLALVLRNYAFASYYVPSPSMKGTLYPGDKFIAEKFSTKILHKAPQRGEIIIFHHPEHQNETWVKRVIGLPGDLVEIRGNQVLINNNPISEEYVQEGTELHDFGPVSVPEDNYFVMGDNRNNSLDSRFWGYLPKEYIEGSPIFIFWPPRNARSLLSEQGYEQ